MILSKHKTCESQSPSAGAQCTQNQKVQTKADKGDQWPMPRRGMDPRAPGHHLLRGLKFDSGLSKTQSMGPGGLATPEAGGCTFH